MAEKLLVASDIDAAGRLVSFLDENGFPVEGALWLYESDAERWRFVISMREKRQNVATFYWDVAKLINAKGDGLALLELYKVNFVDTDRSIVRSLAVGYKGVRTEGRRLVDERVNDVFVEEALILRLPA